MFARPFRKQYAWLTWLAIVMAGTVPTAGVLGFQYLEHRLVKSKGESLALAASEIADKLDWLIAERANDVRTFSIAPIFQTVGGAAAKSGHLEAIRKVYAPLYLWIGVTDARGRVAAAAGSFTGMHDMSQRPWFRAVRENGNVHIGNVEPFEEAGGIDALSFTAPIKDRQGKFLGTITTRVGLPVLEEILARTILAFQARKGFTGTIEYQFFTDDGDAFIDSDLLHKGNVNLKRLGLPSALFSDSRQPGYIEEVHLRRHVPVVTGYAQTQGHGLPVNVKWTILLHVDQADLLLPIRKTLWTGAAAGTLLGAPMFIALIWSTRRLRKEWMLAQQEHARAANAESKYSALLESTDEGIYGLDHTGCLTFINKAGAAMTGFTPQELLGRSMHAILHHSHTDGSPYPEQDCPIFQAFRSNCGCRVSTEVFWRRDGTAFPVEYASHPIKDKEGSIVGAVVTFTDITERRQSEETLRKNEESLQLFMEATNDCLWNWDLVTAHVSRSPSFNTLFGYAAEEIVPTIDWWAERLHPDDRKKVMATYEMTVASGRTSCAYEYRFRRRDGSYANILDHAFIMRDGTGTPVRTLGAMTDITDRKEAEAGLLGRSRHKAIEAELSLLAATIPDLSNLLHSAAKLITTALELEYCEVLELLPHDRALVLRAGVGWTDDLVGQAKTGMEMGSLTAATLRSSQPVIFQDLKGEPLFSSPSWLRNHGIVSGMSMVLRSKEEPWGTVGAYTTRQQVFSHDDVSFFQAVSNILAAAIERAHAESVLQSANRALRTLSRQLLQIQEDDRRTIARDLHDEIGQSLTAIKLNVERAQRTPDRAARDRIMKDCIQITDGVLSQVRNLSLDLHPSILDDLGLAYALKWYADRQAERAGLKVEVTADLSLPRLPPNIEITCFRIAQEALTNVVRHAQASRASITLRRWATGLELRVQDDGIGFVMSKISWLPGGVDSIGLTSMHERAELSGGTLKITSAPRCGTEVIATLPLPAAPSPGTPAKKELRA